jgi:hypothetical protein
MVSVESVRAALPHLSDEEVAQAQAAYESGTNDEIRELLAAERVRRRGIRAEEKLSRVLERAFEGGEDPPEYPYLEEYYLPGER